MLRMLLLILGKVVFSPQSFDILFIFSYLSAEEFFLRWKPKNSTIISQAFISNYNAFFSPSILRSNGQSFRFDYPLPEKNFGDFEFIEFCLLFFSDQNK